MTTLVFLEHHDGELQKGSLCVLAKAASLGGDVAGVVLGAGAAEAAAQAGAGKVYACDDPALAPPLPSVVAVSDAINEPRYPSLKGIMGAKKKPQDSLSLSDLGVDAGQAGEAGSRTSVLALKDPPPRGDQRRIDGDGDAPEQIVDFLAEKRLI